MNEQPTPGLAAILGTMQGTPAVPAGWDAVLNLSQSAVQSLIRRNWDEAQRTAGERSLLWMAPAQVNGEHDVVHVKSTLPPPAVSLSVSDQAVHVSFGIDSGTVHCGKIPAASVSGLAEARSLPESGQVTWSDPVPLTQQDPLHLSGLIPLTVEVAHDGQSFSIGLKLADGNLTLSGPKAAMASQAVVPNLQEWLGDHRLTGQIGNLKLRNANQANHLTPAAVTARIAPSCDGMPVLQILTGTTAGAAMPALGDPVPHPEVHDFSLIVSSKAAMTMIADSYNLGTGVIKLASVPPQDGQPHWTTQVHEPMVFEGTFGNQNGEVYATDHAKLFMGFGGSADQGLKLFTSVDPSSTVQLQLDLAAHFPVGMTGTGTDQVIGLQEGAQSVAADGFYEALVKPQLESFLTGDIRADMSKVRLTAVSDLALRDLSLSGHTLQFEVAALPAELLVAGSLLPTRELP